MIGIALFGCGRIAKGRKRFLPMQEGDVLATYTDASALAEWVGFQPTTSLSQGIERFVKWYVEHYAH